ncbi:hypothetical protein LR48_Vigan09g227500 [Vigna angularis]|uniref:GDSL esterase/lipase n=1 Tax=Phaseolus angularis TaxID=3914 RepID=A0A0L9VEX9_PHAAN|nr:GDSL esterase/lipase [Vigna angularis]KOM53616.1 hypothetical protein LR48_Vigan09g227500 [Vigna angularis]
MKSWLLLSLLLLAANMLQQCCVNGQAQVPGVFVFGGTLSDHGNNNNLRTSVKSNYMPYGIDFSRGSTGRFSNGKTQVDIIAEFLRLNTSIPPYANTTGSDILKGVTYASGSAGIRDETGRHLVLRSLGARKFVFFSPGRIGCTPYALSMRRTNGSCVEEMNAATSIFTGKLRSLVDRLNNNFGDDSRFMFVNNSARNLGVVATGGFTVTNASCCPTGTDLLCDPNQTPCQNRNQYVFWDKFVFTEAFNRFLALLAYNGSNRDFVYPVNISTLVQS